MFFITKRKHNRLLEEERERSLKLGYGVGYKVGNGGKGFIVGREFKVRWLYGLQQAEHILKGKS